MENPIEPKVVIRQIQRLAFKDVVKGWTLCAFIDG